MIKSMILGLLLTATALAAPATPKTQHDLFKNTLPNSGFEEGAYKWSGTVSPALETGNPGFGRASLKPTYTADNQYVESGNVSIPEALYSQNCIARVKYSRPSDATGARNIEMRVMQGATELAKVDLPQTAGAFQQATAQFICPSSGSYKVRFEASTGGSGTTSAARFDEVYLGEDYSLVDVSQAEFMGAVKWVSTTNCRWTSTSTSWASFAVDADCTTPTGSSIEGSASAPASKIPAITFSSLPPGRYVARASGSFFKDGGASAHATFRFHDGTNAWNGTPDSFINSASATTIGTVTGEYTINQTQTSITLEIQSRVTAAQAAIEVSGNADLYISLYKYPTSEQKAKSFETSSFIIDANIGGGNPDLGTSTVSSYTEITNASLDMVKNSGSRDVQIPCSTTNPSTGLTCSVGNEGVGVVFDIDYAGAYEACFSFSHRLNLSNASANIQTVFEAVETPNNAQTILQRGKSRIQSSIGTNLAANNFEDHPIRVCGLFQFSSSGQKTLRLMYTQTTAATVAGNIIFADRSAGAGGDRDIHVTVKYIEQQFPAPVIVNSITNDAQTTRIAWVRVDHPCSSTPCTIADQSGEFTSITRSIAGAYVANIAAGKFSATPVCHFSIDENGTAPAFCKTGGAASATSQPFDCINSTTGARLDSGFMISCIGHR